MREKHIVNLLSALIVGIGLLAMTVIFAQWSNGPWRAPSNVQFNSATLSGDVTIAGTLDVTGQTSCGIITGTHLSSLSGDLSIQGNADENVVFFDTAGTGENPYFAWKGRNSGDTGMITCYLQGGDGTNDMNVMNCVQDGHLFKIDNGAVATSFNRGTTNTTISYLTLERGGTTYYISVNTFGTGLDVSNSEP